MLYFWTKSDNINFTFLVYQELKQCSITLVADLWDLKKKKITGEEVSRSGCCGNRGDRQDQVWGWGSRTPEMWGPVTESQTREWAPSCRPWQGQKGTPRVLQFFNGL